jgi:YegS/Rv2252/BmrU family lipid kinase
MTVLPESAPPGRALLLVNPHSRRGDEGVDAVIGRLEAGGVRVLKDTFSAPEEVEADILRRAAEVDSVIVCGGDGTLCLAAPGLVSTGLPLGVIPMGTANDLARTLGIPEDPEAAAEVILGGWRRRIDLGTVNGKPFFNVASIGLSADLAETLTTGLKRRWGRAGYALAAIQVLSRARRFSAWITENDTTTRVRTMQIAVGNGRFYGGGTVVEESAEIDDGHLDLYSLEMRNVWKLALMLRTFRSGTHGAWTDVRTARGTEFEIRTRTPRPVNADGELITKTPATFKCHPEAVTVFTPGPGGGPGVRLATGAASG